jgi:hypothetical protein
MSEMQMYNKKLRDLENERNSYMNKAKDGQSDLEKAKNRAK